MNSRIYRIPKGEFCIASSVCPFLDSGFIRSAACIYFHKDLLIAMSEGKANSIRTAKCKEEFPYGGFVTVDKEGPNRADLSGGTP